MVKKAVVIILVLLVIVCAGAYILYQNRPEPEAQLTVYLEGYCGFYIMPDKTMEIMRLWQNKALLSIFSWRNVMNTVAPKRRGTPTTVCTPPMHFQE